MVKSIDCGVKWTTEWLMLTHFSLIPSKKQQKQELQEWGQLFDPDRKIAAFNQHIQIHLELTRSH